MFLRYVHFVSYDRNSAYPLFSIFHFWLDWLVFFITWECVNHATNCFGKWCTHDCSLILLSLSLFLAGFASQPQTCKCYCWQQFVMVPWYWWTLSLLWIFVLGKTNHIAHSVMGTADPATAALHIVFGKKGVHMCAHTHIYIWVCSCVCAYVSGYACICAFVKTSFVWYLSPMLPDVCKNVHHQTFIWLGHKKAWYSSISTIITW